MKTQEANRLAKIVEGLKKVHACLDENKVCRAKKTVERMVKKLEEKLADQNVKKTKKKATGYSLFVKENYKKIAKENPGKTPTELFSMLAKLYRSEKEEPSKAKKTTTKKPRKSKV